MRSDLMRGCWYTLGLLLVVQSLGIGLLATSSFPAPEIDSGSLAAALGLVSAGVLILRSRRRSK